MINLDKVNLPVCAIGAGLMHAAGVAALLPMLITLPAPGPGIESRLVAIDVAIIPAPSPVSMIVQQGNASAGVYAAEEAAEAPDSPPMPAEDHTGALPGPADPAPEAAAVESVGEGMLSPEPQKPEAPAVATVAPEASPAAPPDAKEQSAPAPKEPHANVSAKRPKPKVGSKAATPAKVTKPAPKKSSVAHVKPPKPVKRRPVARASDQAPYKGSWGALLGAPAIKPVDKRK